jgi:MarR family transcriptional regulator for hemolysin
MERDGWVIRETDALDRRIKKVVLTDQSKEVWNELSVHSENLLEQAYQGIDPKDIETIIHLLKQIRENLGMDCC